MKIEFFCNIENCETLVDVASLLSVENIGWDETGQAKIYYDDDYTLVWVTCWSSFSYTIKFDKFSERKFKVEFRGALNGFLKQNLLPNFTDVLIQEMCGKLGHVPSLGGKEKLVYDRFHVPAIKKLKDHLATLLPKTAADSLMELEPKQIGQDLLNQAGLVFTEIHGWAWWSTSCGTMIYRGYTTNELAEEFKKIQEKEVDDNSLSVKQNRANYQEILWNWIEK